MSEDQTKYTAQMTERPNYLAYPESTLVDGAKTNAACKAAICDDEAQGRMANACNKIDSLKGASIDLRIEHAEIYIYYLKKAQEVADKLVFESGE